MLDERLSDDRMTASRLQRLLSECRRREVVGLDWTGRGEAAQRLTARVELRQLLGEPLTCAHLTVTGQERSWASFHSPTEYECPAGPKHGAK